MCFLTSPPRRPASAVFNCCVATLAGAAFRDTQAGLKALRRDSCGPVFELLTVDGLAFDVELLLLALHYRLSSVEQFPVKITRRTAESSLSLFGASLAMLFDLFRINFNWKSGRYRHPLLERLIEQEVYAIER